MSIKTHLAAALAALLAALGAPGASRAEALASAPEAGEFRPDATFLGWSAENPPAALVRAVEAYRAGRNYVAFMELRELAGSEAPGLRPDAWFYLGQTSLAIGMPEEAVRCFWKTAEAGGERNPFLARSVLELARLNFRWGEHAAVVGLHDRFGAEARGEPEFAYLAGESLTAVGRRDEGATRLDGLAFAGPYYPFGQYSLAQDAFVRGDYEEALKRFDNALRAPGPTPGAALLRERARLAAGQILYEQGRYEEAVAAFYEIGPQSPQYWKARLGLGWCHVKMGDYPMAIAYFEEIVDSRPKDPSYGDAYLDLGRAYVRVALYDDASKLFRKSAAVMQHRADELRAAYGAEPVTAALVQDLVGFRAAAEPYLRGKEAEIAPLERRGGTRITNLVDAAAVTVFGFDEKEVATDPRPSLASYFVRPEAPELPAPAAVRYRPGSPFFHLAHEIYAEEPQVAAFTDLAAESLALERRIDALLASLARGSAALRSDADYSGEAARRAADLLYETFDWRGRFWNAVDEAGLRDPNFVEGRREDALDAAVRDAEGMAFFGATHEALLPRFDAARSLVRHTPLELERKATMLRKVSLRRKAAEAMHLGVGRERTQMLAALRDPKIPSRELLLAKLIDHQRGLVALRRELADPIFTQADLEAAVAPAFPGFDLREAAARWRAAVQGDRTFAYELISERLRAALERDIARYAGEAARAELQVARAAVLRKEHALSLIQEKAEAARRGEPEADSAPLSPNPGLLGSPWERKREGAK